MHFFLIIIFHEIIKNSMISQYIFFTLVKKQQFAHFTPNLMLFNTFVLISFVKLFYSLFKVVFFTKTNERK